MTAFALIRNEAVHQVFDADPGLGPSFDVRDVSDVKGIAGGWRVKDGSYAAPDVSIPDPPAPAAVTKLGLKRALAETGKSAVFTKPQWQAVKDFLAADADLQEEWDLAVELRSQDHLVQAIATGMKWKDAQVTALLIRANELMA